MLCHGMGFGVVSDVEKQIEWCTKAAKGGHLEAQLTLAVLYEKGKGGIAEDKEKALDWYRKAARAGDKGAQKKISYFSDKEERAYWRKCAENNKTEPLQIKFDFSLPLIHRAVELRQTELVRSLVEQSLTQVELKDRRGRTPLHVAAESGEMEILDLLASEFKCH